MLEPTIPPPMRTTSAVCMGLRDASGKCRSKANPNQHHESEPAEHHGKCRTGFDLADTSNPDRGQDHGPDGKHVKRRQEAVQNRIRSLIAEAAGIVGPRSLQMYG